MESWREPPARMLRAVSPLSQSCDSGRGTSLLIGSVRSEEGTRPLCMVLGKV